MSQESLNLYLVTSSKIWCCLFVSYFLVLYSLPWISVHIMLIGLITCVLSLLKLPSPVPAHVQQVLGDLSHTRNKETGDIVAHRGACLDAPENSVEAVREAKARGATWIEFDVSFTSDGVGVVFHDDTVDRITTASGPVSSFSVAQLSALNLATKFNKPEKFSNVRIATVEEFVAECIRLNMKVIIDLKTYTQPRETIALLTYLYSKHPTLKHNSIVTSFFPNLLYALRSSHPDAVAAISTRPGFFSCQSWEGTRASVTPRFSGAKQLLARGVDLVFGPLLASLIWWMVGLSVVLVHRAVITREYVDTWRQRGVTVMAWTVNCPTEKRFYRNVIKIPVLSDTMDK